MSARGRYAGAPVARLKTSDGAEVAYLERPVDSGRRGPVVARVRLVEGDRLDNVAARALGDWSAWWRVADTNDVVDCFDVPYEPGRVFTVTLPVPK